MYVVLNLQRLKLYKTMDPPLIYPTSGRVLHVLAEFVFQSQINKYINK